MSSATLERDLTEADVNASLAKSMDRFARADVEGLVSRYDDDILIRFADLPEIRGKAAAERFLRARFAVQRDYKVSKTFLLVAGQKYANSFTASWTDMSTGKHYEGRGVEVLQLRNGKVVQWDCSYNIWEAGAAKDSSYFGKFL
jgi:ketosteroid isomerase-like protein